MKPDLFPARGLATAVRTAAFAFACTTMPAPAAVRAAPPPITVADAIRTAFIVPEDKNADPDHPAPVSVSPDGRRFAVRVATGDLDRNGIRLDVLTGSLDSLEGAARPARAASLFSPALGDADSPYHPALANFANPIWIGNATIAFPWEDGRNVLQYVAIDLSARRTRWLTRHPTDVLLAASNRAGDTLYAAQRARTDDAATRIAHGFVVAPKDAVGALRASGTNTLDLYYDLDLFLAHRRGPPRKLDLGLRWAIAFQPLLSPDGRFLVVNAWPAALPERWRGQYRPDAAAGGLDIVGEAYKDRSSWYGRQVTQLFVVDMRSGAVRPLWDAPTRNPVQLHAAWSPDGSRVAIGATYAPPGSAGAAGAGGAIVALVERTTGQFAALAFPEGVDPLKTSGLRFRGNDRLEVDAAGRSLGFERSGTQSRLAGAGPAAAPAASAVRVELRQAAERPPRLFAVETAGGRERLILDPNPGLAERFALGRVEAITFPDRDGRQWSALLYHPVDERSGAHYPLVIQAHGHAPVGSFSLYGLGLTAPGTGPSWSVYAAQPLAGRGMFVLQLEDKRIAGVSLTPREPEMYMRAYEGAVGFLDARGVIDRSRVGLAGFSRSGWHIEYALAHSDFVFAAAISSDNVGGSYLESLLNPGSLERENGGAPFGSGLETWLEAAPAFSAERVRTPLRAQVESGGLAAMLFKWELFARLRQLDAPVELAIVPQVDKGSHNLLNPRQVLAVKQGAVDWFDFWLTGREDGDPSKADQYRRWRLMREQRDRLGKVPRPPLLDWSAKPR
jgi:dipeptidyl aminopeptidase/acylaminoacyl peptidase